MMDSPEMSPLSSLPSSQESTPSLDGRDSSESTPITSAEQTPTPKKREPKPRLGPQTIDFQAPITDAAALKVQKKQIDRLVKVLQKKKKIVVIAGAGISVNAGIPDFRSSAGLFSTLRSEHKLKSSGKDLFDASVYKDNAATSSFHKMIRDLHGMVQKASPTSFHHLLASLASEGRLLRLYSQNVDCIDTSMEPLKTNIPLQRKGPWPKTVQLHGALETMVCSRCKWLGKLDPALFDGPSAPDCMECTEMDSVRGIAGKRTLGIGKLRPRMVLYNEENPDAEAIGAVTEADLKTRPDCVIVVGTSLKIPGVKRIVREMCSVTQDIRGGTTIWINRDEPPPGREFEGLFDLIVKGSCEKVARLVNLPHYDGSMPASEDEMPEVGGFPSVEKDGFAVVIDNNAHEDGKVVAEAGSTQSILTPIATPTKSAGKAKAPTKRKQPTEKKPRATKKQKTEKAPGTPRINKAFKATKKDVAVNVGKSQKTLFAPPAGSLTPPPSVGRDPSPVPATPQLPIS